MTRDTCTVGWTGRGWLSTTWMGGPWYSTSCGVGFCFVFDMVQHWHGWRVAMPFFFASSLTWRYLVHARRDAMSGFLFVLTWVGDCKRNFETSYAAVLMP